MQRDEKPNNLYLILSERDRHSDRRGGKASLDGVRTFGEDRIFLTSLYTLRPQRPPGVAAGSHITASLIWFAVMVYSTDYTPNSQLYKPFRPGAVGVARPLPTHPRSHAFANLTISAACHSPSGEGRFPSARVDCVGSSCEGTNARSTTPARARGSLVLAHVAPLVLDVDRGAAGREGVLRQDLRPDELVVPVLALALRTRGARGG